MLRIDYGLQEIVFDDERLFAFGESLGREASFLAGDAVCWGDGYSWVEVRVLLEQLLEQGVLQHGQPNRLNDSSLAPSLLPPAVSDTPRMWSAVECEAITLQLSGRAVEFGYLEAIVPVFRIAHPALDADGRQVGEGNVFPSQIRLDRVTEWRICSYSGSRYRDRAPMNITALKAMVRYWKPMMASIALVRNAMHTRFGSRPGPWSIGELHLFSAVVLGMPAFQLLKCDSSALLHPVMSSLFRITDGIRMVTAELLFSIQHSRRGDDTLTAEQLYASAEQYGLLIGDTGVCAGPKALIEEFLAVAVDGMPADERLSELPREVRSLLAELPDAIDYALYGMQTWGVSLALWLAMSRAYEAVRAFADSYRRYPELQSKLVEDWQILERLQLTVAHDRKIHQNAYRDAYERAHRALRGVRGETTLDQEISPVPCTPMHDAATRELAGLVADKFQCDTIAASGLAGALIEYLRIEQAVLLSITRIQLSIDVLLGRASPRRSLESRDLLVYNVMVFGIGRYPYLLDVLEAELGIHVHCTATMLQITNRGV